jgi:S-formylglutathione hydrolase
VLETLNTHASFSGTVSFHRHVSTTIGSRMRFSIFVPQQAQQRKLPVIYFLAGLTCTEETFMIKSGAQRMAAELGLILVCPDTSPRESPLPGDRDQWDFGIGAGFYLDATRAPWSQHYRMYSYVTQELPALVEAQFPADPIRTAIMGHSMGGHGALTIGLKNPARYRSISAFAPIAAPTQCPWGQKAFVGYLGDDQDQWREHDASELVARVSDAPKRRHILIDQGLSDQFLGLQLKPEIFEAACKRSGYPLTLRRHAGYDHSYYFISTFIDDHLVHHAKALND